MTQTTIGEFLAEHDSILGILEDIEDSAERERFVLDNARRLFETDGALIRTVILRTTKPHKLLLFTLDLPYERADAAEHLIRAAAQSVGARQLYVVMESWFAVLTDPEERARVARSGSPRIMPRNHPDRQEAVVVTSEDASRVPPSRAWMARITRDAKGKPTLGPWEDFPPQGGRMVSLLPPEAFIAAGQRMPST